MGGVCGCKLLPNVFDVLGFTEPGGYPGGSEIAELLLDHQEVINQFRKIARRRPAIPQQRGITAKGDRTHNAVSVKMATRKDCYLFEVDARSK